MHPRIAYRVAILISLCVITCSRYVCATVINAASCAQSDVQTAINTAVSQDTVVVPSGTCAWNSAVNITKAIKLQGAGIGVTVINNTLNNQNGYALVTYSPTAAEAVKVFEMLGFTLNGADIGGCFKATNPNSSTPITSLKIHDNNFINGRSRGIILTGMEFGVFYNNTFSGHYIAVSDIGAGNAGWNYAHTFGSVNMIYFEDNTFGNGTGAFIAESGQGGRYAFRHNTISGYACSGCEVFDVHGNQGDRGTVISEFYHNTIGVGASGTFRWMHHRGGMAIIANNTVSRNIGFNFTEYRAWGGNGVCEAYPALDQINNSFYFNNIVGGSSQTPSFTNGGDPGICGGGGEAAYLVINRDYRIPSSGTAAVRPATCTTGTFYGATDTDVISECTSTNVWTVYFQPYAYPHTLRGFAAEPVPTVLRLVR